jgi:hypothetical protein
MIESDYFLSARSRRAKSHPDINLAPESFAAHIALQPIEGYPFPPPMFLYDTYEFEAFDHLEQAVADWKTLFNPLEGNLTTAILDLPELRTEGWEKISIPDIVMLSSTGDFGKWNFGFEVQVGWNKQLQLPAPGHINPNPFGGSSPIPRLPTPQSDHSEGSVMFHFTYEAGSYTFRTGWTCPWCEGHRGAFGSMDELETHLVLSHELFHFRIEVYNILLSGITDCSGLRMLRRMFLWRLVMNSLINDRQRRRERMTGCLRIFTQRGRRGILGSTSKTESLRTG